MTRVIAGMTAWRRCSPDSSGGCGDSAAPSTARTVAAVAAFAVSSHFGSGGLNVLNHWSNSARLTARTLNVICACSVPQSSAHWPAKVPTPRGVKLR